MRGRTCRKCFAPIGYYPQWINGSPYCPEHAAEKKAQIEGARVNSLDANRTAKALRLVDVLRSHQATAAEVKLLPEETWATLAELAEVKMPSEETRAVVIAVLEAAERTPDPFEGLT
jgi:hypothetical protein